MDKNINSQNVLDIMARHYVQAIHEIYELCDLASSESVTKENSQNAHGNALPINIGANIRAIRKSKGITQAELAKKSGCGTQSNIGQIEGRRMGIRMTTLVKIADALDVSPEELMTYREKENGFGFNLLNVCKENEITIKEVAEGTGIPKNTLYNITKRNTKRPRGDVVQKVFEYLQSKVPELTIDDLVKEEQE